MSKQFVKNILIFLFSLSVLIFLISQISIANFEKYLEKLNVLEILTIVLLIIATTFVRGIRLRLIMRRDKKNLFNYVSFSAIHNFLNHVVPFRLGELSLPILINRYTKETIVTGALSFVIIRLYDLIMMLFFFSFRSCFQWNQSGSATGFTLLSYQELRLQPQFS
jgi:uncharacterized membrane protein YbhN (UPF0104 family)